MTERFIWFFANGQADASSEHRHLVGGKGASLADMTRAGLNVPPGFTISAACCDRYYQAGQRWPEGLEEQVRAALGRLEQVAGRSFGQGGDPLLLAVRSGAAQSMPGMMDTILNVGLNPDCVRAMAQRTQNPRAAWDAYRHFLVMFGHTVAGIGEGVYSALVAQLLEETGCQADSDLDAAHLEELCNRFRAAYLGHTHHPMPTQPWDMLRLAIDAVFNSWNNERAVTYRRHHQIEGLLGTAVNVQMMCPAEVSGVMFTANPVNPRLEQVLVESSYGLGEAVVLGKVTPDRFVLDRRELRIAERHISDKRHIVATLAQDGRGQSGARDSASLADPQVLDLARLGLRVEQYFQTPCDIEWALSGGKFYLLQARPIKFKVQEQADDAEREQVRQEEIARLKALAEPTGTVWSRYNLSEILPEPTPMTWEIVRRFMSGQGGFGRMYRDLGFDPHPGLDELGIYDLVCGRPYCNLSREPRMQFASMPFEHPFAVLKANPQKAMYPQAVLNPGRAGLLFWVKLPWVTWKLLQAAVKVKKLSQTFAQTLRQQIIPAFVAETEPAAAEDLAKLGPEALLDRLQHWTRRTLYDFARDSLKPTALAGVALANLERALLKPLGPQRLRSALGELVMGVHPDPDADLPGAIRELAAGRLPRAQFLQNFGHRGSHEMELAHPRWSEDHAALDQLLQSSALKPAECQPWDSWQKICDEAKLTTSQRALLEPELRNLHTYLALRETGKHYLMKGYALVRRVLVELDRRFELDGGIFYLTPEELPRLVQGEDLSRVMAARRRRRELALEIEVPQVLFSDDLEAIGRASSPPAADSGSTTLQGAPLSAGVAEGAALVLLEPETTDLPAEPFILVCPSTDPAWVPLFVQARALVMETGGVLSHGAIVAREYGLPAVAGLPEIHRRIKSGQRLRVDGGNGTVTLLG
jgi:pyruvate,water dikinase